MKRKLGLAAMAVAIAVLLAAIVRMKGSIPVPRPEGAQEPVAVAPVAASPLAEAAAPSATASPVHSVAAPRRAADADQRAFREKFGENLVLQPGPDGRISRVRGSAGQGARAAGFDPNDPRAAIARAREVLAAAGPLLGVTAESPLGNPLFKGSQYQADVSFQEEHDGAPVVPYGKVSVRLGPQGEVLEVASSYVAGVHAGNRAVLSSEDARSRALAAFPDSGSARVEGGEHVLWVGAPSSESGGVSAKHAYDFQIQGHQIVIDAETGKVIFRRDRRQF